jgi:hypothetical protein
MSIVASIINLEQQIVAAEESIEAAELEEE